MFEIIFVIVDVSYLQWFINHELKLNDLASLQIIIMG